MTEDKIEALEQFLAVSPLQFEISDETDALRAHSIREITVVDPSARVTIPVFDEFRDVEIPSRVVRLHLVLDACECFEEAGDFDGWRADVGFHDAAIIRAVYAQLTRAVPAVRALVGRELEPISSHAIEFNTTLAVRLRACRD